MGVSNIFRYNKDFRYDYYKRGMLYLKKKYQ